MDDRCDDVVMHSTWHLCKKYSSTPDTKCLKEDVVSVLTFDLLIGLLPTNQILLYYNGIPDFTRKQSMLTVKYKLKQCGIFEILLSVSWIYEKWQTSVIIQEISDSNLDSGRYGPKSGVSWQHPVLFMIDVIITSIMNYCNMNQKAFLLDWLLIFRPQGNLALVWMHQLTCSSAESSSLNQLDSLKIAMWMHGESFFGN